MGQGMANKDTKTPLFRKHERGGLVRGERDGELVSVDDVENGLACRCFCPACGAPLVAKQGPETVSHFAHHVDTNCKAGFETILHRIAKEVLAEALIFEIPEFVRGSGKDRREIVKREMMTFDRAELEKRSGRIVADVVLYSGNSALLVELVVTHWCPQEKIDLLKLDDISCVEVDLSGFKEIWTEENLRDIIVKDAPRKWLHNRVAKRRIEKIHERLAAEHEHKVSAQAESLNAFYERARRRCKPAPAVDDDRPPGFVSFDRYIGLEIPGDLCFLDRVAWQKTIVNRLVRTDGGGRRIGLPLKHILDWVRPNLDPGFSDWLPDEIADDVQARVPEFRSAYDVVLDYMKALETLKFAAFDRGWHLSSDMRCHIRWETQQAEFRSDKHDEIETIVTEIMTLVPDREKSAFDYEVWLDESCELGITVRQAIEQDTFIGDFPNMEIRYSEDYALIRKGLRQILDMLKGRGDIVDDLFNLPLRQRVSDLKIAQAFEFEQAVQRRIGREHEVGRARERRLINTLKDRYPGHEVEKLVAERSFDGLPAFQAVRSDDVVYQRVLNALEEELDGLEEEARRCRAAEEQKRHVQDLKNGLLQRCDGLPDAQQARLYLTTSNPACGSRPIDRCKDQGSFDELWRTVSKLSSLGKSAKRR